MLKLAKLEMKKVKFKTYVNRALICNATYTVIFLLIVFTSKQSGHLPFKSYDKAFIFFQNIIQNTFIIFAAVLISRLIIDEYKYKTITVVLMYPVNRKKLIITKFAIIVGFTFASVLFSNILMDAEVCLLNHFYSFLQDNTSKIDLIKSLYLILFNAAVISCLSLIPLFIGMRKKTVPATIVTAVIITVIIESKNSGGSLISNIIIPTVLALAGVAIAYFFFRNIENTDIEN